MKYVAEIKFQPMQKITMDTIQAAVIAAGEIEQSELSSTGQIRYIDTADYKLAAAKVSLSINSGRKPDIVVYSRKNSSEGCWAAANQTDYIIPTGQSFDILKVPEYFAEWPEKLIDVAMLQEVMTSVFDNQQIVIKMPNAARLIIALENAELAGNGRIVSSQTIRLQLIEGDFLSMITIAQKLADNILMSLIIDDNYLNGLRLLGITVKPAQSGVFNYHTTENVHSALVNSLCVIWQGMVVCAADFIQQPDNPRTVHQLRVKLRQFRSVLSFAKPLLHKQAYNNLQEEMRQSGRVLSGLRFLDVLIGLWNKIDRQLPNGQSSNELLNLLMKERSIEQQRVLALPVQKILTGVALNSWAFILNWPQHSQHREISWQKYFQKRARSWFKDLRTIKKEMSVDNAAQVHRLRIKVKKLRYVFEYVWPSFQDYDQHFLDLLKELQDNLGELHDCADTVKFIDCLQVDGLNDNLAHQTGRLIGWKLYSSNLARKSVTDSWDNLKQYSSYL